MDDHVKVFKALASGSRLKILRLLREHPQCVNAIARRLSMTQPAVSQHLRLLKEAGLVSSEKRGNWMHYALVQGSLERYGQAMAEILGERPEPRGRANGTSNCPPQVLEECPGGKT